MERMGDEVFAAMKACDESAAASEAPCSACPADPVCFLASGPHDPTFALFAAERAECETRGRMVEWFARKAVSDAEQQFASECPGNDDVLPPCPPREAGREPNIGDCRECWTAYARTEAERGR